MLACLTVGLAVGKLASPSSDSGCIVADMSDISEAAVDADGIPAGVVVHDAVVADVGAEALIAGLGLAIVVSVEVAVTDSVVVGPVSDGN